MTTRSPGKTKAVVTKAAKRVALKTSTQARGHDHPFVQKARLLEQRSPALLEDLHAVLERHGFAGSSIRTLALSEASVDPPAASALCKRWRCHTDENGDTVCGWVFEPCDS